MWNTSMAMRLGADFLSSRLSILDNSGTSLEIALVARALQVTRSTTAAETAFEILAKKRKGTSGNIFHYFSIKLFCICMTIYFIMQHTKLINPFI